MKDYNKENEFTRGSPSYVFHLALCGSLFLVGYTSINRYFETGEQAIIQKNDLEGNGTLSELEIEILNDINSK